MTIVTFPNRHAQEPRSTGRLAERLADRLLEKGYIPRAMQRRWVRRGLIAEIEECFAVEDEALR